MWKYNELTLIQKVIKSKWVFKVKYNLDSSVARFKAKLVKVSHKYTKSISSRLLPPQ